MNDEVKTKVETYIALLEQQLEEALNINQEQSLKIEQLEKEKEQLEQTLITIYKIRR